MYPDAAGAPGYTDRPSAPRTVMCRLSVLARYAWASPATLAGLFVALVAFAFGARGRVVEGVVEVCGGRIDRGITLVPGHRRFRAITFGHVIIGVDREALVGLRQHEHVHVRQYERWGLLFFPAYLFSSLLQIVRGGDPYLDNRFEREAFAKASPAARPCLGGNRRGIGT